MAVGRSLIGREDELDLIGEVLESPTSPGIVIAGAGGVGKTQLARAALAIGRQQGHVTATVIATRATATVPLGALVALVGDPGDRPERLLARARDAIRERAGDRRLLLHVDDAHLLDDVSAAVLLALVDEPAVRSVVTLRTGEPVPDAVTALWKDADCERLDLQPLADHAADLIAETVAGGPIDAPSHLVLRAAGRGNPLAITELVRGALQAGRFSEQDGVLRLLGPLPVSERIAELIGERLGDLDDRALTTLAVVALGEPLTYACLRRLGRGDELTNLERRSLVEVIDDGQELLVRLGHPLHGEVVLDRIGALTRRELLLELVADLTPHSTDPDDDLRLATWSLDAGIRPDPALLVRAARRAWTRLDHRRTADLAWAAWEIAPDAENGHLLGYALGRTGRSAAAEEVLARAADLAADDRARLLVGQTRVENLFRGLGDVAAALHCSRTIEAALDDPDMKLEIVAGRAAVEVQAGRIPAGLQLARPILDAGHPDRAFVTAAYAAGLGLALSGRSDDAMAIAQRALPVHEQVWEQDLFSTEPAVHHVVTVVALGEAGRLREADQLTDLGTQVAGAAGRGHGFGFWAMLRGMVLLRRGRPHQGARWCREAVAALRSAGYPATGRWALAGIAQASALLGDRPGAVAALAEADELAAQTATRMNEAVVDDARGWMFLAFGDPEEARRTFRAAAERHAADGAVAGAAQLAHSLARSGDPATAVELLNDLAAASDGLLVAVRRDHAAGLADHDGVLLDDVAGRFAELGADLDAAEAFADSVRAHHRAGEERRATAARRRAIDLLAGCEGAITPALRGLDRTTDEPLSTREREVALLAAAGLTSRDIAERLHVSARTVDNHLHRVYRKLGVANRVELAGALGEPVA